MRSAPAQEGPIEERSFVGPADERPARRAHELAPLLKVRVMRVHSADARLATRRRMVVRAEGLGPDLNRYWRRLREIEDAIAARDQAGYGVTPARGGGSAARPYEASTLRADAS